MFTFSQGSQDEMIKGHLTRVFKLVTDNLVGELQTLVLEKSFIAGGAIRSLLLNEPINDYDFYFVDEESAASVKRSISNAMMNGTLFSKREKLHLNFKTLTDNALTFNLTGTDKYTIQFITKYAGAPDRVINRFDFTNSMAYFLPKYDLLSIKPEMHNSLFSKELVFNPNCWGPAFSLKRFQKFTKDGWTMKTSELLKLCTAAADDTQSNRDAVAKGHGLY